MEIDQLKAEIARLQRRMTLVTATLLCFAGTCGYVAHYYATHQQTIRAERVEIQDGDGNTRIIVGTRRLNSQTPSEAAPSIRFFDEDSAHRMELGGSPYDSDLYRVRIYGDARYSGCELAVKRPLSPPTSTRFTLDDNVLFVSSKK